MIGKIINQKGWFFVLPVVVLVAFNTLIPLMALVNYSVQGSAGSNLFFWEGVGWFEQILHSERVHAALLRQVVFTVIILLIEMPLGVITGRYRFTFVSKVAVLSGRDDPRATSERAEDQWGQGENQ